MSQDARKRTIRLFADQRGINYTEAATQLSFMAKVPDQPMPIVVADRDENLWGGLTFDDLTAQDWGSETACDWGNAKACQADNTVRAGSALAAVAAYRAVTNAQDDHILADMIGDLRHLCDALGEDFETLVATSDLHYGNEARGRF